MTLFRTPAHASHPSMSTDRYVEEMRSLLGEHSFGLRLLLADQRGHLRVIRTEGHPIDSGRRQAEARRHTLADGISRTLEQADGSAVAIYPIDRRGEALGVAEVSGTMATIDRCRRELETVIGGCRPSCVARSTATSGVESSNSAWRGRRTSSAARSTPCGSSSRTPRSRTRRNRHHACSERPMSCPPRRWSRERARLGGGRRSRELSEDGPRCPHAGRDRFVRPRDRRGSGAWSRGASDCIVAWMPCTCGPRSRTSSGTLCGTPCAARRYASPSSFETASRRSRWRTRGRDLRRRIARRSSTRWPSGRTVWAPVWASSWWAGWSSDTEARSVATRARRAT